MKKHMKRAIFFTLFFVFLLSFSMVACAHSGRTDDGGGHHNDQNESGNSNGTGASYTGQYQCYADEYDKEDFKNCILFDPVFYAAAYSDLAAISNDPELLYDHFVACGMQEGRQGSAAFNVHVYMNQDNMKTAFHIK